MPASLTRKLASITGRHDRQIGANMKCICAQVESVSAHPRGQSVHGPVVEAVGHEVLNVPSADACIRRAVEPATQKMLDAHAAIQLQEAPLDLCHPVRLVTRLHPLVYYVVPAQRCRRSTACQLRGVHFEHSVQ